MFWYVLTLNPVDKPFAMKPTCVCRLPLHTSSKPRGWSTHVTSEWYWGHILSWWKPLSDPWNKQEWVAVAEMRRCIPKPRLSRVVWKLNLPVLTQAIVSITCIFIPAFVRSTSRYSLVIAFACELSFSFLWCFQLTTCHFNFLFPLATPVWCQRLPHFEVSSWWEVWQLLFNKSCEKEEIYHCYGK